MSRGELEVAARHIEHFFQLQVQLKATPAIRQDLEDEEKARTETIDFTTVPAVFLNMDLDLQILMSAKEQLLSTFGLRLQKARQEKDHANMLRYVKLHAPLGAEVMLYASCTGHSATGSNSSSVHSCVQVGALEVFIAYLRDLIRQRANVDYTALVECTGAKAMRIEAILLIFGCSKTPYPLCRFRSGLCQCSDHFASGYWDCCTGKREVSGDFVWHSSLRPGGLCPSLQNSDNSRPSSVSGNSIMTNLSTFQCCRCWMGCKPSAMRAACGCCRGTSATAVWRRACRTSEVSESSILATRALLAWLPSWTPARQVYCTGFCVQPGMPLAASVVVCLLSAA